MKQIYNHQSLSRKAILSSFYKIFIGACLLIIHSSTCFAQGDLLISPLRVVFEGNKKSQEINLANVGKDTAVYAVSIVDIRMKDDGSFESITEPDSGQRFAGPYLRFFPRKVTLAPNEAQVVKVQLVKTNQLLPGEYRSHIYFRAVPEEMPQGEAKSKKDSGISIHLKPIFGITIPIIIRSGETKAEVTFSDVSFERVNDKPTLSLTFNRTGNISAYGELTVDYISPGGKSTQVAIVKGIGIYTPNALRHTKVELDSDKNIGYDKGKLHINYSLQTSDKSGKNVEAVVELK
jgi:P pilus assembly chaperone PapD